MYTTRYLLLNVLTTLHLLLMVRSSISNLSNTKEIKLQGSHFSHTANSESDIFAEENQNELIVPVSSQLGLKGIGMYTS